jgi:hypothetical protein
VSKFSKSADGRIDRGAKQKAQELQRPFGNCGGPCAKVCGPAVVTTAFTTAPGRLLDYRRLVFRSAIGSRNPSNQLVHDILEELLTPASVLDWVGLAQDMFFERGEALFARFDGGTNAAVPRRVAIL